MTAELSNAYGHCSKAITATVNLQSDRRSSSISQYKFDISNLSHWSNWMQHFCLTDPVPGSAETLCGNMQKRLVVHCMATKQAARRPHSVPLDTSYIRIHEACMDKCQNFQVQTSISKNICLLSSIEHQKRLSVFNSSARFGNIWGRHGWNQVSEVILLFCDCLKKSCKSESISCKTSPNLQGHPSHCTLRCQNCKRFSANADIFVLRKQQN